MSATLNTTNIKHASSGSNNIVLAADGSTTISNLSGGVGKILQVVQNTKTDTFTTTSASDVEVTGLNVTITPSSASNKVLVSLNIGLVGGALNAYAGFVLYREIGGSSSDLLIGTTGTGNRPNRTFGANLNSWSSYASTAASFEFLDTPNTTSAITYKVKVRSGYSNVVLYINRMSVDDNENYNHRCASTYIAQEVAA